MLEPQTISTSVARLMGRGVVDAAGNSCGTVQEFAVDVSVDQTRVAGLVLRQRKDGKLRRTLLPVSDVSWPEDGEAVLKAKQEPQRFVKTDDYLLLDYDVLDQQIIDVNGRKVVRVNDVNLVWEPGKSAAGKSAAGKSATEDTAGVTGLRIEEVEVGTRGATRRLFKGLPAGMVEGISGQFKPRSIPWDCVDLIERDPARRVRLKIGQERLSKLHPSDIAEILEELAPVERDAVFSSLPEETAAEALEEVEPKLQKALLQGLDSERAADILEEMDPGAAADVLAELSDEESEAILEEMEPEERQDVEELLEFESHSAAGAMTTDYVSAAEDGTVADAVAALREFEGDADTVTEVYLLGEEGKLKGVVTLTKLLLAPSDTPLATLADRHNMSCGLHATEKEVATLFDKYNLRSLAVVDAHKRMAGVIHAEQVIAQLLEG